MSLSGGGMKYRFSNRWSVFLLAFTMLSFAVGLIESIDRSQKSFLRDSLLDRAKEELSIVRSELESAIVYDIFAVDDISALVASNPNFEYSGWDLLASSIMRKANHVTVIGLAPDDVIKYIYPLEGNEKALGLDYRTVPSQWRTIKKARAVQEIFIAGPVNLVQGGRALVARIPIFTDPLYNRDYWGVCSVVISLETLFADSGVEAFSFKYNFAMRGTNSSGANGSVFYGVQKTFDDAFATETVHFPYGSWRIAASTKDDLLQHSEWYRVHAVRLLGYPMVIVLLMAFLAIFRLYQAADRLSLHDELTSLPNRRYFMYTLQAHFDAISDSFKGEAFAILNVDLDKFKLVNDTYGHAAGDKVLITVAERIKSVLRASDVVARIGGDEFLIMLPRMSSSEDVDVINIELQKAICRQPVIFERHLIDIHVSIGFALYRPEFKDVDEMLKLADIRMYEEKRRQS
ncbi:sensor domain-containing diguanylate cyclase [Vibrio neptunius]|uniref:Sensor domain-containing diguanylate cyclase n=2 Tax=Vibrio neptunius TaxID=170651 RepID=A0ABS3A732_9VIBR|nr:sensor domain-containing diguanylate cyclase [Vibrio neptunius]MBN3517804.1 sensor domain-containing diguanylate cyclase [Vibrio neptunius]MBN3552155.1 sensor domain-containing diguanylate cyclase [Vibrio neptunius]MBN3580158.1 sensor domain-containing diguanylate cyclase [Vibrio neptunius]MCH9873824.1 sensor domain-containing diguanylate cyclase [Vibrio neptunius]